MVNGEHRGYNPLASPYGSHDFADFAQEFLRRNPAYREAASFPLTPACLSEGEAQQRLAHAWGLCRLVNPDALPRTSPALWQPACHPAIVQIRCSHLAIQTVVPRGYAPLAEHRDASAHHLVLGRSMQRLRLCLWHVPEQELPVLCLAKDKDLPVRLGAAAFYAAACSKEQAMPRASLLPSPYQRAALVRLLQIFDALGAGASCRDIAWTIVFPRHERLTGSLWKGSAERRHCWRLISQARRLADGGHLRLLALARGPFQA